MKVELLDSNLNLRTKYLVPQIVSLSDVFQVVGSRKQQVGYPELRRDVKKKGFKNPIVVHKIVGSSLSIKESRISFDS